MLNLTGKGAWHENLPTKVMPFWKSESIKKENYLH
jgi:hypothetical protein